MKWTQPLALLALMACTPEPEEAGAIPLGAMLTATGDVAGIGGVLLRSAQLAVDQINDAGGILDGQSILLVNQDDGADPDVAESAMQAHINNGIPAVLGGIVSSATLAAASVGTPKGVVMVSPASSSATLTDHPDDDRLYRTCPSDALQGTLLAQRALAQGLMRSAIIYVPGAYGEGMAATFTEAFEAGGGTVSESIAYTEGQNSYVSLWTTVLTDPPEAVALLSYPADSAKMIDDYLATFAASNLTFLFADALANADFVELVGANRFAGLDHEGTAPSFNGPEAGFFDTAYTAAYGEPPGAYQGNAYDGMMLLALAVHAGGKATGTAVRDNLRDVSSGGTRYGGSDISGLLEAISRGDDVDYVGASGEVDFDTSGDIVAPYDIWQVGASGIVIVEQAILPQ